MSEVTESKFLESYDKNRYEPFAYTADLVIFTIRQGKLSLLLVERGGHPFKGYWALPGGFVTPDEDSEASAQRELMEETSLSIGNHHLEQLKTYSAPKRDPRMRVISTAYLAFLPDLPEPTAGDDAANAHFFPVEDVLSKDEEMNIAFDHRQIIQDGLDRVSSKIEYTSLAMEFLPEVFTLSDLRRVYESIWNVPVHPANFRRKILSTPNLVAPLNAKGKGVFTSSNVSQLYSKGTASALQPAMLKSSFINEDK